MFSNHLIKSAALASAAAALTVPALAHAGEAHEFVRDGISYAYKSRDYGNATVITGSADAKDFRLVVRHGVVNGEFNGRSVHFKVADASVDQVLAVK